MSLWQILLLASGVCFIASAAVLLYARYVGVPHMEAQGTLRKERIDPYTRIDVSLLYASIILMLAAIVVGAGAL